MFWGATPLVAAMRTAVYAEFANEVPDATIHDPLIGAGAKRHKQNERKGLLTRIALR
jgi:hypothetical protein